MFSDDSVALGKAMACGRAVVTTDVPGCRDAVLGLNSGLLVPPRDTVALAGALESLITTVMKEVLLSSTQSRLIRNTKRNHR